jgi:DNA polymerase elongation subunit (family B)
MAEELKFQIVDWNTTHEDIEIDGEEFQQYVIKLFGRTEDNRTVFLKVQNFTPYFYIEIPGNYTTNDLRRLIGVVKQKVYYKHRNSLIEYKIVKKHKFYGFTDGKLYTYALLKFHSYWGFKAFERVFNNPIKYQNNWKKFQLYESNIEPFLRFMHIRDISACGWVKILKYKDLETDLTICDLNYQTKWTNIISIEEPKILPLIVASFDIECTSGDGKFPQAKRPSDKIIQIGTTFHKYGSEECYYKHIITLGSCDKIENIDVESYDTEEKVLLAWTKLIKRVNPDVLTGYNIFGFDYKYMFDRAKLLGVEKKFMKLNRDDNLTVMKEKTLVSSALGKNILYYFDMIGRIQIDLMKVVQKDYNLSSYKLDSVGSNFIRENINNIIVEDKTSKIYTTSTYGLKKKGYITIYFNDGLTDNKYNDGKKYQIKSITKEYIEVDYKFTNLEEFKKYKFYWCLAKDDVPPSEIFRLQKGSSKDRSIVARYCVMDCEIVSKLVAKLQVLTNNISMANVCSVPLSYLFLRGQGVKIFSLVSKKCRKKHYLIQVVKKKTDEQKEQEKENNRLEAQNNNQEYNSDDEEQDGYEGATVFQPEPSVHFTPIPVLDYASLYPRSMIHRNLSHECLLDEVKEDKIKNYNITRNETILNVSNTTILKILLNTYMVNLIFVDKKTLKIKHKQKFKIEKIRMNDKYFTIKENLIEYMKKHKLLDYQLSYSNYVLDDLDTHQYKTVYSHYKGKTNKYVFAQKKDKSMGIVPEILQDLLDARQMFKDKKKIEKDKFLKEIWDGTQLAYKVTANSLYGQTGAPTSPIYLKAVASSTTATGREMLNSSKLFTEYLFAKLLNLSIEKDKKKFKKVINHIFNKEIDEVLTKDEIKKLKKPDENNIIEYNYFNIFHEKDEILTANDFINKKLNHTNKKDFIKYLYKTCKTLLKNKTVSPKCIYGDTDSIFVNFYIKENDKLMVNIESLEIAIKLGVLAGELINFILPYPHNLEYEKTFFPFVILSKKRYVGNLYEYDPNQFSQKSMGIVLKRRDNADIVKIIVGGLVKAILNDRDSEKAVKFVKTGLKNILCNNYPIEKFIITKTLKGPSMTQEEYKEEMLKPKEDRNYVERKSIVHAVLSDRIKERSPGNEPQSNDRIPYAYVITKTKPKLQGDRVEHPEYIKKHNLKLDYLFYITNQIMKPSIQFLDLLIKKPEKIFNKYIIKETNRRKGVQPLTDFFTKNKDKDADMGEINIVNEAPELEIVKKTKKITKRKLKPIDNKIKKNSNGHIKLEL